MTVVQQQHAWGERQLVDLETREELPAATNGDVDRHFDGIDQNPITTCHPHVIFTQL
jgi:hypothetical protein